MANKKWTLMIYMAGDNDLYEDMAAKLIELKKFFQDGKTLSNIGIAVYFDGGNPMISTQQFNLTANLFGSPTSIPNAADPLSVSDFVKWCVEDQELTADNYAFIFSGHGDGFQRTAFLRDMSSFDFMTVRKLKEKIREINAEILKKDKVQILAFDSCVMGMIEVVNEFKEVAEVMVSSEGYMPTTGLSYTSLIEGLANLDSQTSITADSIAELIVHSANDNNDDFAELTLRSLDMSVLDLERSNLDSAIKSINDLGTILKNSLKYNQPISDNDFLLVESLKNALLTAHWTCQTYLFDQAVDITDFCEALKSECFSQMFTVGICLSAAGLEFITATRSVDGRKINDIEINADISPKNKRKYAATLSFLRRMKDISDQCEKVIKEFGKCVTHSCFSGPDYQYSNGLAVYFPWSANTFEMTKYKFKEYDFACQDDKAELLNPWYSFLETYLNETLRLPFEIKRANEIDSFNFKFSAFRDEALFAGRVMLDPPPRGMLASETQYKEYFMRTKNFPLKNIKACSK